MPHVPRPRARVYYKEYFFPDSLVDGLAVVGGAWWVVLVVFGGVDCQSVIWTQCYNITLCHPLSLIAP